MRTVFEVLGWFVGMVALWALATLAFESWGELASMLAAGAALALIRLGQVKR